jgi:hypothetical protein
VAWSKHKQRWLKALDGILAGEARKAVRCEDWHAAAGCAAGRLQSAYRMSEWLERRGCIVVHRVKPGRPNVLEITKLGYEQMAKWEKAHGTAAA